MMAILPPTSPTTVIGGFSLAIITAKGKQRWLYLCTPANGRQRCLIPKQIGKVDEVKWVERVFFFRGLTLIVHKGANVPKAAKKKKKNQRL